jgi:hypothetical protein
MGSSAQVQVPSNCFDHHAPSDFRKAMIIRVISLHLSSSARDSSSPM